jgi:tRNA (cmo5U34)-methyltransferase
MSVGKAFDQSASYYDTWVRKGVPGYDRLFGAAIDCIPFRADAPLRVLDLGAGTGLFSKLVLERYPAAQFVLVDVGEQMLAVARERFAAARDQFRFMVADIQDISDWGAYNLVISSLVIHHLSDEEKQQLFAQVYRLLDTNGVFINVDQIRGETPFFEQLYWDTWLEKVRLAGGSEEQIAASVERRITYDQDALLGDQLAWLRQAGFSDVDCVYRDFFAGVFVAAKTPVPGESL